MAQHVTVSSDADGRVVTLTLNRPDEKSAMSMALRDEVTEALGGLAADEAVRCVVITGAGTTFSAGFDLGEFGNAEPGSQDALWASSDRFHHAVLRFPLPAIAAVNGPALAGGFDLAVLCDLRTASAAARFAHPGHAFRDVVHGPLHGLVGGAVARDLASTGRSVDAAEAHRLGIVGRVVPDDELPGAAAALARQVASAPRAHLARTKAKAIARAGLDPTTGTLDL